MTEWERANRQAHERIAKIATTENRLKLEALPCPRCSHPLRSHDPEDGTCDHRADGGLGVCPCGRVCPSRKLGDEVPNIGFPMRCSEPGLHGGPCRYVPDPERVPEVVRLRGAWMDIGPRERLCVEALEALERRLLRAEGAYERLG